MANAPLSGSDGGDMKVICFGCERKYFCERGWTGFQVICPSGYPARLAGLLSKHSNGIEPALWVNEQFAALDDAHFLGAAAKPN